MRTFWDKQSWATGLSTKRMKNVEQQKLPDDFEWSSHSLETIYDFLKENYVSAENFKLRYTMETLKWAIDVPGHQNICINEKHTQKIIGLISLTPFTMKLNNKEVKSVQVNFLCVHKDYRNRKLVGYLVTEAKRISESKNRNQSIATIHNSIPGSILKASYWHRLIDVEKLVKVGFYQTDRLKEKYFEVRGNSQFRKMTPKDVPKVTQILKDYFKKFKIVPVVNETWVKHWLLPRDGVMYSYLNDETSDFLSFYSIPYDKVGSTDTVNQAYLFYMTGDNFNDAFLIAQNAGFDVFNTLDVVHSEDLLKKHRFLKGTGYVNYHLFDWKLDCEIDKTDINIKIP
jgi:glycylpeptide N-tetradecanoyltransferase